MMIVKLFMCYVVKKRYAVVCSEMKIAGKYRGSEERRQRWRREA